MPLCATLFTLPRVAVAGSGPWTLSPGEHNVYVGADYFRYQRFNGVSPGIELSSGLTAAGLTGVWTTGLAYGLEAEFKLAFESVRVNDARTCLQGTPSDFCEPTAGIGDLAARVKWRAVDEAYGAPLSVALHLSARSGEAYAGRRGRLTTLGDGQTDAGAGASVGRTDTLGKGWYMASVDATYWYRFPNVVEAGRKVPTDEISADADVLVSLHPRFGIGPSVSFFTRTGGVDFVPATTDFFDPDLFNRLDASQLKVGGKLGIYSVDNGPTVSVAALWTVAARNNPSDTFALSVGVGQWLQPRDGG